MPSFFACLPEGTITRSLKQCKTTTTVKIPKSVKPSETTYITQKIPIGHHPPKKTLSARPSELGSAGPRYQPRREPPAQSSAAVTRENDQRCKGREYDCYTGETPF